MLNDEKTMRNVKIEPKQINKCQPDAKAVNMHRKKHEKIIFVAKIYKIIDYTKTK